MRSSGLLLVLLVATLMGGLAPPSSCGPGAGARYAPSRVALADIPGNYLRWIRQAGDRYGLDWSVIAGIYSIETDFGRLDAPGVRSGENSAGAGGPGQFLEPTWRLYGVDGDGDGVKDRYNPADAIPGTANLLAPQRRAGGLPAGDLRLQPRELVRRRRPHPCSSLPRRGRGRPGRSPGRARG